MVYRVIVVLPYILNVTFKTTFGDAVSKASHAYAVVLILSPSNETELQAFDEYVNYFRDKVCGSMWCG